jgi:hypothetical protein
MVTDQAVDHFEEGDTPRPWHRQRDFGAGPHKVGFPSSRCSPINNPKPAGSDGPRDPKPRKFKQRRADVLRILLIPQHRAERSKSGRRAQKAGLESTH